MTQDKSIIRAVAWTRIAGSNNMILSNDDFRISYNPVAGAKKADDLGAVAQLIGGLINGEGDPQEETALYDNKTWRILKGDFRKEYENVFPNWDKCLAVYDRHKAKYRSEWSTD